MSGRTLLFEIGTDELPAGEIDMALAALKSHFTEGCRAARLSHGEACTLGTPRRLALLVRDVAERAADAEETFLGPAASVAFGADGNPTRAALGFARSRGVDPSALARIRTDRGEYVAATVRREGAEATPVLAAILNASFAAIPWKRAMRWGWSDVSFSRPVHWIVALLGGDVLPVGFGGIAAGRASRGHRFLSPAPFDVSDPEQWRDELRSRHVIADVAERRDAVRNGVLRAAADQGLSPVMDESLLDEVVHLVEWPVPLVGRFDEKMLEVPREVLITSMRTHQRYFAMEAPGGRLANAFCFVSNMVAPEPDVVIAGNRRVLTARLEDARFFFREDRKRTLASRVDDLQRVVYIEGLGSMRDRTERIVALTLLVGDCILSDVEDSAPSVFAQRAAMLCKADLTTGMVYQFPELQGTVGRYYALHDGEPSAVATAIEEHYRPRGAGDSLPATLPGVAVSLADKIDAIAGCFALGLVPSGSADPYALRRAALGIVRMVCARRLRLPIADLLGAAWDRLPKSDRIRARAEVVDEALDFILGRLRGLLANDHASDIAEAVVAIAASDLSSAPERAAVLTRLRDDADFSPMAAAYKRVVNILRQSEQSGVDTAGLAVDPGRFDADAESRLFAALTSAESAVDSSLGRSDFAAAAATLIGLRTPVDAFFDGVLVNATDAAVRVNRIAMLARLRALFGRFADLSKIQSAG